MNLTPFRISPFVTPVAANIAWLPLIMSSIVNFLSKSFKNPISLALFLSSSFLNFNLPCISPPKVFNAAAAMTPEQRREWGLKAAAALTPEQRCERAKHGLEAIAAMPPDKKSARGRKTAASLTPEGRSARSQKGADSLTREQRRARSLKAAASKRKNLLGEAGYVGKLPVLNLLSETERNSLYEKNLSVVNEAVRKFKKRPDFRDIQGTANLASLVALTKWDRKADLPKLIRAQIKYDLIVYFSKEKGHRLTPLLMKELQENQKDERDKYDAIADFLP